MAEDEGTIIKSLTSVQLPMEPACLEFCPAHPEYLIIGSWHLIKDDHHDGTQAREQDEGDGPAGDHQGLSASDKQRHMGRVDLYRIQGEQVDLVQTDEYPESAIWDVQFQKRNGRADVFAAGSSAGTVFIYKVTAPSSSADNADAALRRLSVVGPISGEEDGEVMITKCYWHPMIPDLLAVSTLAGEVHLIWLDGKDDLFTPLSVTRVSALAHSEPAWTVALSPQVATPEGTDDRVFTVYSGGDDMAFRYASVAMRGAVPPAEGAAAPPEFDDALFSPAKKSWHMAGVVSILPLPITLPSDGSQIVVTGSYDDHVRVCAVRPLHETYGMATARVLTELHLGGGAWRLRVMEMIADPSGSSWRLRILTPCMSVGSRVLEICGADDSQEWTIKVLGSWWEEAAGASMLNYGSDVQPRREGASGGGDDKFTCVSSNFYGKMLYLWKF
ncbi:hypothetical protein MCOR27_007169 [Pyricularia oryzae]|uniref:WD40 repeat-like protein n=2 Tax=Pyricularia TaxID=48558 RepID=A0ABQ8NQV3_PYRGI|nr:hypothetical protein MCOR01_004992 [Pyricularia oryzae]KAI6300231.1 hypothetical protein MCOR33_004023 [Pyricularia grisea]KAH9431745.1 hypothetical protein MCOR02_009024 [Pyricularia oryzae]KAI6253873.1 hypothetical protein MCOR19_009598 [Pyricularia oryzae]KAI6273541.1 hypothetical protein MCOR26_006889 [Pyricularia oryzae]